jgi:hypothetical protein
MNRPARYRILLRISQLAWVLAIFALAGAIGWKWQIPPSLRRLLEWHWERMPETRSTIREHSL